MGAADLVPGVSGGTVAFITGIYGRLVAALAAFSSPPLFADLLRADFGSAWRRGDCGFLSTLAAGILSAVLLLGNALHYLLREHAHLLLAFFCGLVAASAVSAARLLQNPKPRHIASGVCGAVLGLAAALSPQVAVEPSFAALFMGGAVAICAMLLPGISGSYILLVLGLYARVLDALRGLEIAVILAFAAGCAAGLLSFSRLLSFMLRRWHDGMVSFLIGVMLGALPKLWPWKEHAEGAKIIMQPNVLPGGFAGDAQTVFAAVLAVAGALFVLGLSAAAKRNTAG